MGDEDNTAVTDVMRRVTEEGGVVPHIWRYEFRNALLTNERRGRISVQKTSDTLVDSLVLNIERERPRAAHDHRRQLPKPLVAFLRLQARIPPPEVKPGSARSVPLAGLERAYSRFCSASSSL